MGKRGRSRIWLLLPTLALAACSARVTLPAPQLPAPLTAQAPDGSTRDRVLDALDRMPLLFIENQGQADSRVPYYVQGSRETLYFTPGGITLSLAAGRDTLGVTNPDPSLLASRWTLKLDFLGASPVEPVARSKAPTVVSYFKGSPEEWHAGLPTYTRLVYGDLWPGINALYRGTGGRLKYAFHLAPGADPGQIRQAWRGATGLRLTEGGGIRVTTPLGAIRDRAPIAWQEVGGRRVSVPVSYNLEGRSYGFRLGTYDPDLSLFIDPSIVYAGYIGGNGDDDASGIAVDSSGAAYLTGSTTSPQATFPETVGPDLTYNGGNTDAFVAKVLPSGAAPLVYAGYIGGNGDEDGRGIAVDASGAAYVTGETTSHQASFPVVGGPDLTYNGGSVDAFVAKVRPSGAAPLVYAGYIGGGGADESLGIAVDASGAAHVTGETDSHQGTFPETVGPDLTYNGGSEDAFVAKVRPSGAAPLLYAGYIGGNDADFGRGIDLDAEGVAYVTGGTSSHQATFPETVGPDLTYNGGFVDAFVAKVRPSGAAPLLYAGYIGGQGDDVGLGIAVGRSGGAYVTGQTDSHQATFPETVGPDLTFNGAGDAFVAKVRPTGAAPLLYAGYIGGNNYEQGYGIAVDSSGAAYVVGTTDSNQATFPETVGPDLTYNGGISDAFVAKVSPSGAAPLLYAGYIGGNGQEEGRGMAVGSSRAYVTGSTDSHQATFPETVGPDLTYNGGNSDAFVAKVSP